MNWISTKEKKPEYGKRVLAYSKGEDVEILKLEKDNEYGGEIWLSDLNYYKKLKTVDFWRELPKPPNNNQVKIEVWLRKEQYDNESKKWECTINGELKKFDSQNVVWDNFGTIEDALALFKENEVVAVSINNGKIYKFLPSN